MNEIFQSLGLPLLNILTEQASIFFRGLLKQGFAPIGDATPRLDAAWVVSFRDAVARGKTQPKLLDVRLEQCGRKVRGVGCIEGEPGDPFIFEGRVKRNLFYGSFRRKDPNILAGTGTFSLKIAADSRRMKGFCAWHETLTDGPWASCYNWRRKTAAH